MSTEKKVVNVPDVGIWRSCVETKSALSRGARYTLRHIRLSSLPAMFLTMVSSRTGCGSFDAELNLSIHTQDEKVIPDWGGKSRSPVEEGHSIFTCHTYSVPIQRKISIDLIQLKLG